MLREIDGIPLVRVAVDHALAACRHVILVVGHEADAVRRAAGAGAGEEASAHPPAAAHRSLGAGDGASGSPPGDAHGTRPPAGSEASRAPGSLLVVENEHYRDGMFGSIQAGMRHVTSEWFFIAPGDMPRLVPELYEAVARGAGNPPVGRDGAADGSRPARDGAGGGEPDAGAAAGYPALHDAAGAVPGPNAPDAPSASVPPRPLAVVPYHGATRGHPVLVHASLIPRLLAEPRSAGPMRDLLVRYPVRTLHLDDPALTLDLDTDHDYRAFASGPGSPHADSSE